MAEMNFKHYYRKLTKAERGGKPYKYKLKKEYIYRGISLGDEIMIIPGYVHYSSGLRQLYILFGYAWDGSTVVMDTKACMRASLVHDCGYQLLREGLLDRKYRKYLDQLYRDMCIEDGMWKCHANFRYTGLRLKAAWDKMWRRK